MIVDALRCLRAIAAPSEYEYVGFGGIEFVDFELVRRELGIDRMTSIEESSVNAARYRFNRPFANISVRFDRASAVLPTLLDEPVRRIVWLDYDCALTLEVLQTLGTALRKLAPGSVLLISVDAQAPKRATDRLTRFSANVELERTPVGTNDFTLAGWGWAAASHSVLTTEAAAEIARRYDGVQFEQLFHIHWITGARRLTWGGLLLGAEDRSAYEAASFSEQDVVRRSGEAPYEIAPPLLTTREVLYLNAQLPADGSAPVPAPGISSRALTSYARLYRWYPPIPAPM